MAKRFLTGLIVGLLISLLLAIALVLPAVLIIRLFWGVWLNSTAWLWIVGVLASQTLATAFRHAWRRRNDQKSPGDAHGSAPP